VKRLLLIFLFVFGNAHALEPELEREFTDGGGFEVVEVVAPGTPTPFMTGYQTKSRLCSLLVNTAVAQPTGIGRTVAIIHEAGHCRSLRLGLAVIEDGVTKYGEAFGDVFALAWFSKYHPDQLDAAMERLYAERAVNRMISPEYNTLFVMRRARVGLPTSKEPVDYTIELLTP